MRPYTKVGFVYFKIIRTCLTIKHLSDIQKKNGILHVPSMEMPVQSKLKVIGNMYSSYSIGV